MDSSSAPLLSENSIRRERAPLLRVQDVSVRFGGIMALDRLSFDVSSGTVCSIIGPNGAGKTTLFNCLSRLYPVRTGDILYEEQSLLVHARHEIITLGIARTFQNLALFRDMSVRQNVMLGAHCRATTGYFRSVLHDRRVSDDEKELEARAQEAISFLDLNKVAHRLAGDLPFGIQKRVELARALTSQPKLILLDEPAGGLNHEEVDNLKTVIRRICERLQITVLLVEHHMNLVMSVSDKVVALSFGRKITDGSPEQVQQHPEVIKAYLGGTKR